MSKERVGAVGRWLGKTAIEGVVGNLAWTLLLLAVAALLGSGAVAFFFRTALAEFFSREVRVWHLFVGLGVVMVLAGALAAARRLGARPLGARGTTYRTHRTVELGGMRWEVQMIGAGYPVYGPRCARDGAYLEWRSSEGTGLAANVAKGNAWKHLLDGLISFTCPKCNQAYSYNGHGDMPLVYDRIRALAFADDGE